eukprot:gene5095-7104_t
MMRSSTFIIDQFHITAKMYESRPAIHIQSGEQISYRMVSERADLISYYVQHFANLCSDSNMLVAVMVERSPAFIVSILGILKAAGVFVPVDPTFPPDRQQHILQHSKCGLLITDGKGYESLKDGGDDLPTIIVVDFYGNVIISPISRAEININKTKLENVNRDDSLAYVLYTSGSTGKPKGVMVKNIGVINIVTWFAERLNITCESRVMGLTTFCFDISVLEIFLPLLRGGMVVLAESSLQKNPFDLIEYIKISRITVFQATPTTYEMMLATGWTGDSTIDFLVGGEAFRPSLLPLVSNSRQLLNVYGPTETTIWSSTFTVTDEWVERIISSNQDIYSVSIPIGEPISETTFHLVSESEPWREEIEEGELWIGGVGRFLQNPFAPGMVYRTGDLVKKIEGTYVFVRRLDDQVKIGGFRIELQEIEAVYSRHEYVAQAFALVRNGKLCLYLKFQNGFDDIAAGDKLEKIHSFSAMSLTYYMIPKCTVVVETFPQTPNGKLDRKALPDPPLFDDEIKTETEEIANLHIGSMPTRSKLDEQEHHNVALLNHVCGIVESVRGRRPGVNTSFAAMGMDSLGAVVLVKRLSDGLDNLKIEQSFLYSSGLTVHDLVEVLRERLLKEKNTFITNLEYNYERERDLEENTKRKNNSLDLSNENDDEEMDFLPCKFNSHFEALLGRNVDFILGLRGFYAFMVLWDHYHGEDSLTSSSWAVDTGLFVLISGLTTSFQLRIAPKVISTPNGVTLLPLQPFKPFHFLISRAIGIFPVLWIGIIISIPFWLDQAKYQKSTGHFSAIEEGICAPLYVIGFQSWVRPQCHHTGPNHLVFVFGSIILNVFIIYSIGKFIWSRYQLSKFKIFSTDHFDSNEPKSVSNYQKLMIMFAFNRAPTLKWSYVIIFIYLVLLMIILLILLYARQAKNAVSYLPFFLLGVCTASLLEIIEFTYRKFFINTTQQQSNELDDNHLATHHCVQSWLESTLITPQNFEFQPKVTLPNANYPNKPFRSFIESILWRFLPDALCGVCALCLIKLDDSPQKFYGLFLIPFVASVFIIISFMQDDKVIGKNISRLILESKPLKLLGYCSFPIYLFQRIILQDFPLRIHSYIMDEKRVTIKHSNFTQQKWWVIIILCAVLIIFSWCVQKFIQDQALILFYEKLMSWERKPNVYKTPIKVTEHSEENKN